MSIRNMMIGGAGATAPDAPTIGTATASAGSASVTFTAPANNGGSAITSFTVTSSPSGITASGASSPITVTGLSNGTAYTFTVTATNAIGTSPASSASNSVTPTNPELYSFTTVTLRTGATKGPQGPSLGVARAAAGSPVWAPTYLNMNNAPGIQDWTVPQTGTYEFEIAGASSVMQNYPGEGTPPNGPGGVTGDGQTYGRSAKFTTTVALNYSETLKILCGQLPQNRIYSDTYNGFSQGTANPGCFNGGGGGTFVAFSNNVPICVAGGGGSQRVGYLYNQTFMNARMDFAEPGNPGGTVSGVPSPGGSSGGGATNAQQGSQGGAGFTGNSASPGGSTPAQSFVNGGVGGIVGSNPNNPTVDGGFGGGGHGGWGGSGGGGGYNGGGSGTNNTDAGYGGGGGNYNIGTLTVGPDPYTGPGYVKITKL